MLTASIGSILYSSLTSVIRYVYVRSSLVENVQHILKKDSFKVKSIVFAESLLIINIVYLYSHIIQVDSPRPPFLLYQACVDPWGTSSTPLLQVASAGQFMVNLFNAINIVCNICLFKYLDKKTKKNTAWKAMDKKAERKRNLYPAWLGLITLSAYTFIFVCYSVIYSFPVHILDSGTKAFSTGFLCDLFHCLITPGVIMFGSQTGKRRIQKIKGATTEWTDIVSVRSQKQSITD